MTNANRASCLPEHMCPGSEGRQVMFCGATLQCSSCRSWLPAYPGSFLAPVHSVDGVLDCHQACPLCWSDFVAEHRTSHACACDVCVPIVPANVGHLGEVSASHALRQAARDRRGR